MKKKLLKVAVPLVLTAGMTVGLGSGAAFAKTKHTHKMSHTTTTVAHKSHKKKK
jgi:hypothetical protein